MNKEYARVATDGFTMGRRESEFMLACETTARERYMALALLSEHYRVDLYSTDEDIRLKNVRYRGYADYFIHRCRLFFLRAELIVYENIEDLFYKAKYYLEHEDERKQVELAVLSG